MARKKDYTGFTLSMALVDCIPVALFSVTAAVLAGRFASPLFTFSVGLIILSGALKCVWKFVLALLGKDIPFLFFQMRAAMPLGFLGAALALILDRSRLDWSAIWAQMSAFPSALFYLLGFAGMGCMVYFARHFDSSDAKSNWIEQGINALAQLCFLLGVLF